jgi:dolichol kinase
MASIVGKKLGRHPWGKWTPHPQKTIEGSIAGAFTTAFGSLGILILYPFPKQLPWIYWIIPLGTALLFFLIDVFNKFLVDNLLNGILCGGFVYLCYILI